MNRRSSDRCACFTVRWRRSGSWSSQQRVH